MKNNIEYQMDQFLKGLFPDRTPEEAHEEIEKHGKSCLEELGFLKNNKDAEKTRRP